MSDTDFIAPLRETIENQITFNTPRLAPYFLAAMDLLFNDLEIGAYKPSDRCNAGLEQLAATLEDLSDEAEVEVTVEEEEKEKEEDKADEELEKEEATLNVDEEEEEENEDEEGFLA